MALRFDNGSCCHRFPFLDAARAVGSHFFAGPAVGIYHALAASCTVTRSRSNSLTLSLSCPAGFEGILPLLTVSALGSRHPRGASELPGG